MSFLLKDPQAVLDYSIDWGAEYLADGELIGTSEWYAVPDEADGISVIGSEFDAATSTIKARAGVAGRVYRLVNRITTGFGRTDERSIVVRVEKR